MKPDESLFLLLSKGSPTGHRYAGLSHTLFEKVFPQKSLNLQEVLGSGHEKFWEASLITRKTYEKFVNFSSI